MRRSDLLALTPDDLATLSNRGTVKRAQKELEAQEVTCEIHDEHGGELIFRWSDGITCRFPAGKPVHDAVCSSGLAGISRHIIRSVLAYQIQEAGNGEAAEAPASKLPAEPIPAQVASSPPGPDAELSDAVSPVGALPDFARTNDLWDPGTISDEALIAEFRKPAILQARKRFEQGVLVELTRGTKPVAQFLNDGCTVRFLVPGDLRYISADCSVALLPTWVPLAVWAFRELPADRLAGLLCLQQVDLPIPESVMKSLDQLLSELCREGLSTVAGSWSQKLSRIEPALRSEGLVWLAELVVELLHQYEMYRLHDALFDPRQVVQLTGELLARTRAIRSGTRAVPQPFIRGTRTDRATDIAGGRMIGVGLGVRPGQRHTTISAYLQDADSGSVVAVERTYADPAPASGSAPRPFADLAATVLVRGVSLASLATSQLLLKSGKRTPSGQLILPRTASSLTTHPQSYQWEQLKPPFAAECLSQLTARLETLPPSCLRPRRRTENLHVVAVQGVDEVNFNASHQRLTARLRDSRGEFAELIHPFHARAREGFNDLVKSLEQRGDQVRFVCGHVRVSGRMLQIQPISLILDDGQRRVGIQPWLPHQIQATGNTAGRTEDELDADFQSRSPIEEFLRRLDELLSDLLLTGLPRSHVSTWTELAEMARHIGMVRLTTPIAALADALSLRSNTLHWNAELAVGHTKALCLLSRLAAE